jgi:hypothetical protein
VVIRLKTWPKFRCISYNEIKLVLGLEKAFGTSIDKHGGMFPQSEGGGRFSASKHTQSLI